MRPVALYRGVALLLWALAAYNAFVCRGLFWDGAAFLANIVDSGTFHDFYPARAHVGWVTQLPVLLAIEFGVRDTRVLATVQSAAMFALPVGLYHLALARVWRDATLLATVLTIIVVVYLPTSFFIIGEYNAAYAAATATFAIGLTSEHHRHRDGILLCLLAALLLRSYEAMLYLGPLLALLALWWMARAPRTDLLARVLGMVAALGFLASAAVAGVTVIAYWDHPHFTLVRAAVLDFWQNQQFIVPIAALAVFGLISLVRPAWLLGPGPLVVIAIAALLLVATLFARRLNPEAMLFPPAHYVARTAAGWTLAILLAVMWAHVAWRRDPPKLLIVLRQPEVGRRLATATAALVVAAAIPDFRLTTLWTDYLGYLRGVIASRSGFIPFQELPTRQWPHRLFSQEWTLPALSALLRSSPGEAIVLGPQGPGDTMPFDSRCGTVPRLEGYRWGG